MSLQERIKSINLDRLDVDDMIELLSVAESTVKTYESTFMPVPEWLSGGIEMLTEDVKRRRKDTLKKAIEDKKLRLDSLRTTEQKRADLRRQLASMEKALAQL